MENTTYVYLFEEANGKDKKRFGGKGAGLSEMTHMGLPVPPGLIITTEACISYNKNKKKLPKGLIEDVKAKLKVVEEKAGKRLGDPRNPLLVSVRSGAALSMPGMMDTILNLGLNDSTLHGLIQNTGNPRQS